MQGTRQPEGERLLERREAFSGTLIRLVVDRVELPSGASGSRELVLHPGGAAILPMLPDGRILLVRQYRHATGGALWEVPAGKLDPGEAPLDCAQRELLEETGHEAVEWREIASFFSSPGFSDERITLFLARNLRQTRETIPDEIEVCRAFDRDALRGWIADGTLVDGKTLIALLAVGIGTLHGKEG